MVASEGEALYIPTLIWGFKVVRRFLQDYFYDV